MKALFIITNQYPFGLKEPFLETELPYLKKGFDRIEIAPCKTAPLARDLPEGVFLDTSLAEKLEGSFFFLKQLFKGLFHYSKILEEWKIAKQTLSSSQAFKVSFKYITRALLIADWLKKKYEEKNFNKNTLFYTYWCLEPATALVFLKDIYPEIKLASRLSSYDFYEEGSLSYLPLREKTFQGANALFPISLKASQSICEHFNGLESKIEVARLGVSDHGVTARPSKPNTLHIISCCFLTSSKNIDLWIYALASYSKRHPEEKIFWDHLGGGPLEEDLRDLARKYLPVQVKWELHGNVLNRQIYAFYKASPVDLFVTLGQTNGKTVAALEALSCGIPLLVNAGGGIEEIVDEQVGWVLPKHPSKEEVVGALEAIFKDKSQLLEKRISVKKKWETLYQAKTNFFNFSKKLACLVDEA